MTLKRLKSQTFRRSQTYADRWRNFTVSWTGNGSELDVELISSFRVYSMIFVSSNFPKLWGKKTLRDMKNVLTDYKDYIRSLLSLELQNVKESVRRQVQGHVLRSKRLTHDSFIECHDIYLKHVLGPAIEQKIENNISDGDPRTISLSYEGLSVFLKKLIEQKQKAISQMESMTNMSLIVKQAARSKIIEVLNSEQLLVRRLSGCRKEFMTRIELGPDEPLDQCFDYFSELYIKYDSLIMACCQEMEGLKEVGTQDSVTPSPAILPDLNQSEGLGESESK